MNRLHSAQQTQLPIIGKSRTHLSVDFRAMIAPKPIIDDLLILTHPRSERVAVVE
jgi:hypothetical protein